MSAPSQWPGNGPFGHGKFGYSAQRRLDGAAIAQMRGRRGCQPYRPEKPLWEHGWPSDGVGKCGIRNASRYHARRLGWGYPRPKRRDLALQGYVRFAVDHPDLFELMLARGRTKSDDPELMGNVAACFAVLADIAQDLPLGHASDELTATRAQMFIWSAVHGYAQLCIAGRFKKDEMKRLTILNILPQMKP